MKSFFVCIAALLFVSNSLMAQLVSVQQDFNRPNYAPYYFYLHRALNEARKYPKTNIADTLALFILDSINFHKEYSYLHRQYPHACENRCGQVAVINPEGRVLIPFDFDFIQDRYDSSYLAARKSGRYGVIDSKGNTVIPFGYKQVVHIFPEPQALFCLRKPNGKIGLINKELKPVIPFEFEALHIIDSNILAFKKKEEDTLLLFYNKKGEHLFSLNGYTAKERAAKYISISSGFGNGFKGIIDKKGKWVVPPYTYDGADWIQDDFICVRKKNLCGIINTKGKNILPFKYTQIEPATNMQFIVYKAGIGGVVNVKNEFVIPPDSINIQNFGALYLYNRYNSNSMGLMNDKGERLSDEQYFIETMPTATGDDRIRKTTPKSTIILKNINSRLMRMYRADGKEIFSISYPYITRFGENHVIIVGKRSESDSTRLQFAAADIDGKFIIPFSNNELSCFSNAPGVILAKNRDWKAAYMNARTGEFITGFDFDVSSWNKLSNGYVTAKKGPLYALISPEGKKLTEPVYDDFFMPTAQNRQWFDEEIVCVAKRFEQLVGITKTGAIVKKMR